ncbi:MAG TPA: hypothetical protein P5571_01300 [Candidatus Krumholzibacteria bacterium]|nr:hypothetical protein [Candidatus Krumholzibacteria bacterium]HRX49993.1 hypothetical protein [Candidatus Krumholzibacteria bacterium]
MTARLAFAALLLAASPAAAFVLETSARVEIVPHVEISLPTEGSSDWSRGVRLECPPGVAARVDLVTDDGVSPLRHVSYVERGDGWVRWEENQMTCRLTVTIE